MFTISGYQLSIADFLMMQFVGGLIGWALRVWVETTP